MTRREYMRRLEDAYSAGRISGEAYDAGIMNADIFCDDDDDGYLLSQIPETYAEIEYEDMDSPEAILGARFDDMNLMRYLER